MTLQDMTEGRRADTARRRQCVIKALDAAVRTGQAVSVASIARAGAVDRSFLYRHHDLLERVHAAESAPAPGDGAATVTRASLQADLAGSLERNTRMATRIRQLEQRLAQTLGQQAWQESGLGAPTDIDQLQRQIIKLEQQVIDLQGQLGQREEELTAARGANRELTRALNHTE